MRQILSVAVTVAAAGELERGELRRRSNRAVYGSWDIVSRPVAVEKGLAALSAAAEDCASRGDAAGVAFAHCIEDSAPYPNFLLPRPMFDEALRNASCRLPGASSAMRRHSVGVSSESNCSLEDRKLDVEVGT
eukprot:s1050_g10.t1